MTEHDGYRIPRHEQRDLALLLYPPHNSKHWAAGIPALIEDLAIAITRQDRITSGPRVASGESTQPLPVNLAAADIADQLHDELQHWIDHTCRHRGMYFWRHHRADVRHDFIGPLLHGQQRCTPYEPSTLELARWLATNIIALALSPDTANAPRRIEAIVARARRTIDRPDGRSFLGFCGTCSSQVHGSNEEGTKTCQTCGAELTDEQVYADIDAGMSVIALTAKQAADLINLRYGTQIKAKTIYDLSYRKVDPIIPVKIEGGGTAFWLKQVVHELRQQGKIE